MTADQATLLAILAATVAMFVWGRWRHDMVALGALLASVVAGLVPATEAFRGLGHPAVVTVACVLILSRAVLNSGAIDRVAYPLMSMSRGPLVTIPVLTGLVAVLSAFMNNVGALALLMPLAMQAAARQDLPPGRILMPLAFGSILGGMTTLIGTPPNLIVSGFRAETGPGPFGMFDFTPVGLAVAIAGIAFLSLIGWRLVPRRDQVTPEGFAIGTYLTEARVPEKGKSIGMTLRQIEAELVSADAQIVDVVRYDMRVPAPDPSLTVRAGDVLVIEAEPEALATALSRLDLHLAEDRNTAPADDAETPPPASAKAKKAKVDVPSGDIAVAEYAVLPDSRLLGRSVMDLRLRSRHRINLLAISRHGRRSVARLRTTAIAAGDVLMLQGTPTALHEFAAQSSCAPLAPRPLRLPKRRDAVIAVTIMASALGLAALGLVTAPVAFAGGVLAAMALRIVPPRTAYDAVDWPVIVLIAALIPVAGAMETTGAATLIADVLLRVVAGGQPIVALAIILVVTMTLSDVMNNAATAAVMCPIAIGSAAALGSSADPFLMAVAVGASCAFLTPIGHQNSTLILGPGGFRFGDYWPVGLPLEVVVLAVGVPMILLVWPL